MRKNPLVSVVVTTKNASRTLPALLESIQKQTYQNYEVIVVDNASNDATKAVAKRYTPHVYNQGPERSAQRNYGANKARGEYYLFLDADMVLEEDVVAQCVAAVTKNPQLKAVVVPEKSVGSGFWAQCKALERACYVGDATLEAARFIAKDAFWEAGGYDESLTGPEDWDLPQKIRKKYEQGRIKSFIYHNEGAVTLWQLAQKKYYYGQKAAPYIAKHPLTTTVQQVVYLLRPAFYRNWRLLCRKPRYLMGMLVILAFEQIAGFLGFLKGRLK